MLANKSEPKKLKTRQEVLEEFIRKGVSISAWARDYGVSRTLVHKILNGNSPCRFGQSHKIAVLLGIKDGDIVEEGSDLSAQRSEHGRNFPSAVPTLEKQSIVNGLG